MHNTTEQNEQVLLLQEGGANNIFSELTRAQFRDVRQTIVQAILGTDMSSHMEHCADVFQFVQKAERRRTDEDGEGTATRGGMAPPASAVAEDAGGELDRPAVPPRPPWHVFFVHKPEDRSFLAKTVVHWCVRVFVAVTRYPAGSLLAPFPLRRSLAQAIFSPL